MKKRLISLFLVIATMSTILFAGCGGSKSEQKPEALAGDHSKTMSINTLRANFATTAPFLVRNNIQYHIGVIPEREGRHIGVQEEATGSRFLCFATLDHINYQANIVSIKDAPVPVINQGDKICGADETLTVQPLNFTGYSPLFINWTDNLCIIEEKNDLLNKAIHYKEISFSLIDDNDKKIKDITGQEMTQLDYGQRVEIEWRDENYNGGIYCARATCAYYTYARDEIKLKPTGKYTVDNKELSSYNKEYNTFDPNELEKGYYAILYGNRPAGVFVVQ